MRRPVRDERFIDPAGEAWQVLEIGKWRTTTRLPTPEELKRGKPNHPIPCGPYNVSFYLMVNAAGEQRKVTPGEIADWTPEGCGDPLRGHRGRITEIIRAGAATFTMPEETVFKGDRYNLPCGEIRIDKVSKKLVKGQAESEWVVHFTRLVADSPQLLRRVPSGLPDGSDRVGGSSDTERARIDSAYTSSLTLSLGKEEPESVGPYWQDRNRAEREKERQMAVNERMSEERVLREATNLAARVKQEVIERGAKGQDLTYLLADVYERLAEDEQKAA